MIDIDILLSEGTKEQLWEQLKSRVELRDKMCSDLWYSVMNEQCCRIASRLSGLGEDDREIREVLGEGTFEFREGVL